MDAGVFYTNPFFWTGMASILSGIGIGRLLVPSKGRRFPDAFRSRGLTVFFFFMSAAAGSCLAGFFLVDIAFVADLRLAWCALGCLSIAALGRRFPKFFGLPVFLMLALCWSFLFAATASWKPVTRDGAVGEISVISKTAASLALRIDRFGSGGVTEAGASPGAVTIRASSLSLPDWAGALGLHGGFRFESIVDSSGAVLLAAGAALGFLRLPERIDLPVFRLTTLKAAIAEPAEHGRYGISILDGILRVSARPR